MAISSEAASPSFKSRLQNSIKRQIPSMLSRFKQPRPDTSPEATEAKFPKKVPDTLSAFIDKVDSSVEKNLHHYEHRLTELLFKIEQEKPQTIFFIDRSARAVSWMLEELLTELKSADFNVTVPQIRFISVDTDIEVTSEAAAQANQKFSFDSSQPVLVVDEYSEGNIGHRTVDHAAAIIEKQLGAQHVEKFVFMGQVELGRTPYYVLANDEYKQILYSIQDSTNDSLISKAAVTPGNASEKKRYREIFKKIGHETAKKILAKNALVKAA